jgi:hypothetical protein
MTMDTSNFSDIPKTAVKVITAPALFFREMPKHGGLHEPFLFLICMAAVTGLVGGLARAVTKLLGLELYAGLAMGVVSFALLPVFYALIGGFFGFIAAALFHGIWKLMGSKETYATAYRCIAYLSALAPLTALLAVIPLIGGSLGIIVFIAYLGSASSLVHGIAIKRAWLVFGCVGVVLIVLSVSTRYAAWRFANNMAQAAKSWQGATEQMERSAQEMRQLMERELEQQKEKTP